MLSLLSLSLLLALLLLGVGAGAAAAVHSFLEEVHCRVDADLRVAGLVSCGRETIKRSLGDETLPLYCLSELHGKGDAEDLTPLGGSGGSLDTRLCM